MAEAEQPPEKSVIERMYDHGFHDVVEGMLGTIESCGIRGGNLRDTALALLPPCRILRVDIDPDCMQSIVYCPTRPLEKVDAVLFAHPPSDDVESRCGLSDRFIEWLKKIPANVVVAFNQKGFNAQQMDELKAEPLLRGRLLIADFDSKNPDIAFDELRSL